MTRVLPLEMEEKIRRNVRVGGMWFQAIKIPLEAVVWITYLLKEIDSLREEIVSVTTELDALKKLRRKME